MIIIGRNYILPLDTYTPPGRFESLQRKFI